jgi:hypothetical protein
MVSNSQVNQLWAGLDEPWRESFRQAWAAVRGGNIGVGACASTDGPPGGPSVQRSRSQIGSADRTAVPSSDSAA